MTGVQHYVDSLLGALYAGDANHEVTAFAPALGVRVAGIGVSRAQTALAAEQFGWVQNPRAQIDVAAAGLSGSAGNVLRRLSADRAPTAAILPAWLPRPVARRLVEKRARAASRRYDLLHVPAPVPLRFETYQAKRHVVTIYDLTTRLFPDLHEAGNVAAWERLFRFAQTPRCARVLAISEATKQDVVAHLKIPADRIDVTPLAARAQTRRVTDPAALARERNRAGVPGDAPFVLYAGSLEPRKNLARLVGAFARIVVQEPGLPHHLVLVGGSRDNHGETLRALARETGIGDRLVLPGYARDDTLNALMSGCAVFVYPSLYEGFGLPPLEAMACGAPVIVSDASSLPEVVGDAGVLVDARDEAELAAALHGLLVNAGENRRRRELSLARAATFSWDKTAALTLRSYEAAIAA